MLNHSLTKMPKWETNKRGNESEREKEEWKKIEENETFCFNLS